jgi:hypothetical protein
MKQIIFATLTALALCGCATTEKIADGIAVKNVSGNGTFVKSAVGINTETKIPEISTIFVSGDYSSSKSGTNSVTYREEATASIWNAKSITKKRFLSITLTDDGKVERAIRAVADVLHEAVPSEQETIEENP